MQEKLPLLRQKRISTNSWGLDSEEVDVSFITDEYIRRHFSSAGVLPLSEDGQEILLGAHQVEDYLLWGPFAGRREGGEEPEVTAERELFEELGVNAKLFPPTVLVNMVSGTPKIGVIYPTLLEKQEFPHVPNREIKEVKWFGWGKVAELQDMSDACYFLWGDIYTWILLDYWHDMRQDAEREGVHTITKMHGVQTQLEIGIGFGFSETPYKQVKKAAPIR